MNNIYSVIVKDNNFYTVGSNYNYNSWHDRGYLTKYDENGNILWKRDYYAIDTSSCAQYLTVVQPTSDNGFILGGYGERYDETHDYNPPQQLWRVKTDSLGIDGLCYPQAPALNVDIDIPDTVVCNSSLETYMYISGKSAPYKIEISTGQEIDSIYYPFRFVPEEIGLREVSKPSLYYISFYDTITEATISNHEWGQCIVKPFAFETPKLTGCHELEITVTDAYGESKTIKKTVLAVGDCDSYTDDNQAGKYFKAYPNPATDKVFVEILDAGKYACGTCRVALYSGDGRQVYSSELKAGESIKAINISSLLNGIYILEVSDCYGNKSTEKITKQ
jgi:hypothetical protein